MAEMGKCVPKHPQRRAEVLAVPAINPDNALAYGKKSADYIVINHFKEVYRSRRNTTVHNIEEDPYQCSVEEDHIDMVNINSIIFNSKWLAITANPKILSSQVSIKIPYKVDKSSDGNIMPLHLYKKLFPMQKRTIGGNVLKNQIKMYNKATVTQLGICKVKLEHNSVQKCEKSL